MLARSLAVQGLIDGRKAAILDADPQGTVVSWGRRRHLAAPAVIALANSTIEAVIRDLAGRGADLVLIDTPPTATPVVHAALECSTGAIVVSRPNPEDLESVQESLRVAGAQRRCVGVVLWQAPADKRVRAVSLAREALAAMSAEVCPTAVSASIGYPYAYAEGLTPQEREPEGRARAELAEVWAWLQRSGIVATRSYDNTATRPRRKLAVEAAA